MHKEDLFSLQLVPSDFLLFYSHKDMEKGIFSQWFIRSFHDLSRQYTCCEQYMMYQKAMLFGDSKTAGEIMFAGDQSVYKSLGRDVENFDDTLWDLKKEDIVEEANFLKFSQNPDLRQMLLDTGSKILVEASPHDHVWGIGMDEYNCYACSPDMWDGENLLGFSLMAVRDRLRKE